VQFMILKKDDDHDEPDAIRRWHAWLHDENRRGERARLRRCETLDEVLMQPAFFRLSQSLPRLERWQLTGLALTAGLLAWVDTPAGSDLAERLGKPKPGGSDSPRLSPLRFQRLLASDDPQDFYQSMRRAIVQADRQADPVSLADAILHWEAQWKKPEWYRGHRQWQYRMAKPYYTGRQ